MLPWISETDIGRIPGWCKCCEAGIGHMLILHTSYPLPDPRVVPESHPGTPLGEVLRYIVDCLIVAYVVGGWLLPRSALITYAIIAPVIVFFWMVRGESPFLKALRSINVKATVAQVNLIVAVVSFLIWCVALLRFAVP